MKLWSIAAPLLAIVALCALAGCSSTASSATSDGGSGLMVATACDAGAAGAGFATAGTCTPCADAPSYKNEVSAILQQTCIPCHSPSGTAGWDEQTYADVYNQYGSMLSFIDNGEMPPLNGPPITNAQRIALTSWLSCGAPDN